MTKSCVTQWIAARPRISCADKLVTSYSQKSLVRRLLSENKTRLALLACTEQPCSFPFGKGRFLRSTDLRKIKYEIGNGKPEDCLVHASSGDRIFFADRCHTKLFEYMTSPTHIRSRRAGERRSIGVAQHSMALFLQSKLPSVAAWLS